MHSSETVILDKVMGVPLTNSIGSFLAGAYVTERGGRQVEHMLLYLNIEVQPCILRINSACWTGDIFGDDRCDCNWQLEFALKHIQDSQQGLVIYHMHHEGRANGIVAKLRSYNQSSEHGFKGADAYTSIGHKADAREYLSSITILEDLGINAVTLITNSPHKVQILQEHGIAVHGTIPIISPDPQLSEFYEWKKLHFGHKL